MKSVDLVNEKVVKGRLKVYQTFTFKTLSFWFEKKSRESRRGEVKKSEGKEVNFNEPVGEGESEGGEG